LQDTIQKLIRYSELFDEIDIDILAKQLDVSREILKDIIIEQKNVLEKHGVKLQIRENLIVNYHKKKAEVDPNTFIGFAGLILSNLESKDLIMKLSTYQYIDTTLSDIYPLNKLISPVIEGLSSSDLQFYNASKSLLETILNHFCELLTHTLGVSTDDDFIDSILYFLCQIYDNEGKKIINDYFMNIGSSLKEECRLKLLEFLDYIPDSDTKKLKHQTGYEIIDIMGKL